MGRSSSEIGQFLCIFVIAQLRSIWMLSKRFIELTASASSFDRTQLVARSIASIFCIIL